jgi:hypothetical protein
MRLTVGKLNSVDGGGSDILTVKISGRAKSVVASLHPDSASPKFFYTENVMGISSPKL